MKNCYLILATLLLLVRGAFAATPSTSAIRPEGLILNAGQWPEQVVAAGRSGDVDVFVTRNGMVIHRHPGSQYEQGHVLTATFDGATTFPRISHGSRSTQVTFIHGRRSQDWRTVDVVDRLVIHDIQRGVDVVWMIDNGRIRYDIALAAGVNPSSVVLRLEGAQAVTSTQAVVRFDGTGISMGELAVLQDAVRLPSSFTVRQHGSAINLGFSVSNWDARRSTLIDPIVFGTYLGTGLDSYGGITRLSNGDVAVAGSTSSLEFPSSAGAYKPTPGAGKEGFVAVFDATLTTIKAYTFIGGGGDEDVRAITSDNQGNIYITGTTNSPDFPVSSGAAKQIYASMLDAFVVKLADAAKRLAVGTYVGGNADDIPHAIAIDPDLNIYIVGETRSTSGFPTINGFQRTTGGQLDAFLTKVSLSGAQFVYSTYLGRAGDDAFLALAVDATGAPYCVGYTRNSNWQTAPAPSGFGQQQRRPYDRTFNGGETDGVVVKFGVDGGNLVYSTYWGGGGNERCHGVFVDDQGRCHVTMVTSSTDIADILGFGQQSSGGLDLVLGVFSKDGRDMTSATYFGGAADDEALSVVADNNGNALIGGVTKSMDFPLRGPGSEVARRGATDGFVTKLTTGAVRSSNMVVGNDDDAVVGVVSDSSGDVYFIATTTSSSLTTHDGSYSSVYNGPKSAYIGKIAYGTMLMSSPVGGETWCAGTTQSVSWGVDEMLPTDRYIVEISDDEGKTWEEVAKNISGTNFAWQIRNVDSDEYLVRVRSSRGHVVRTQSPVVITTAPLVRQQPTPVSDCAGRPATLTVVSDGEGNRYQWRRNGTAIQGATSATFTIASLSATTVGRYDCVISGRCNPSATTQAVDVAIVNAPVLSKQPSSQTLETGQRLTLAVESLGSGLQFQWLKNGEPIAGATSATFEIAAVVKSDSGAYSCRVTSECGETLSTVAVINVQDPNSVAQEMLLHGVRLVGPNPATYALTVELPTALADVVVEVQSVTGVRIQRFVADADVASVDVSAMPTGVYLLVVQSGKRSFRTTFVVAR